MKSKNNIEKIVEKLLKRDLKYNLSVMEIAAFKMLQQQKIRRILNREIH